MSDDIEEGVGDPNIRANEFSKTREKRENNEDRQSNSGSSRKISQRRSVNVVDLPPTQTGTKPKGTRGTIISPIVKKLRSSVEIVANDTNKHEGKFFGKESRAVSKSVFYSPGMNRKTMKAESGFHRERRGSALEGSAPVSPRTSVNNEWMNDSSLWDRFYEGGKDDEAQELGGANGSAEKQQLHQQVQGPRNSSKVSPTLTMEQVEALKAANIKPHWKQRLNYILFEAVILPHYRFQQFWEPWIVLCVLWNAVLLPYHLAFEPNPKNQNETVTSIDGLIDWVFIIDLFLNFATAYIDDWGAVVIDRREIIQTYLSKWFWVDLPATLPFEYFVPTSQATLINMVKCIRLMRISKILKFMERFRFANSARIMRLFASLMLVCHWIGCIWFFIGVNPSTLCSDWPIHFDPLEHDVQIDGIWTYLGRMPNENETAYCSWLSLHRLATDDTPKQSKYLRSVYWAVTTITSVGYGDIVPVTDGETLFTILNMLLGAGIYALIFSNFVSYIARIDQAATKYSERMEDIRGQMRYLRLPQHIRDRVEQYFEYVWLCHKGLLDRDSYFFDELPLPLHIECAEFLHMETVQSNPLFKNCSRAFLRGIIVRLKPQLVVPGEYIVNKGEAATAMYFIARGQVEVLTDFNGRQLSTLDAGDYFGDIGLLTKRKRTASIRALTFCDLHYLIGDELRELLHVYEKDASVLSMNALEFVKSFEANCVHDEKNLYNGLKEGLSRRTLAMQLDRTADHDPEGDFLASANSVSEDGIIAISSQLSLKLEATKRIPLGGKLPNDKLHQDKKSYRNLT